MWWKEPPDLKHNICAGHYEIFIFQNVGLYLFIYFFLFQIKSKHGPVEWTPQKIPSVLQNVTNGGEKKKNPSTALQKKIKLSWFASKAGAGKGKKLFLVEGISF